MNVKPNIYNFTLDELEQWCLDHQAKKFNATQIFDWIYRKHVLSFEKMSNLSKSTIKTLKDLLEIKQFEIEKVLVDPKDETTKFLFKLDNNHFIETVLMEFVYGYSVCISSEVGCAMGCKFCASGQLKLVRRLTPGEIVLQYVMANQYLIKKHNKTIDNIVVMGIGEPFGNYDNLIKAIKIFNNPHGIGLGARRITISTCGIVDKIVQFAKDQSQANLAISLHAPINEIRNKLMPINKVYPLEKLMEAVHSYLKLTNRRVTFEYIMLKDVNDTDECLNALIKIAKSCLCYINLIAYNPVSETNYQRSDKINYFKNQLNKNNIMTTLRLERGSNIDAACGQLRATYEKLKI